MTGSLATISTGGSLGRTLESLAGAGLSVGDPFRNPILLLDHCVIAGTTHIDNMDQLASTVSEGSKLQLVREPDNLHDRWAISVRNADDSHLGYLPCDCNQIPARLMDGGKALYAVVTQKSLRRTWHRIEVGVYLDD